MKKRYILPLLFLFSQVIFAQQKTDSIKPIAWSDTINRAHFNEAVISDPLQLILGQEPGAEVFKAGNDPNVASSLMIRGNINPYSQNSPLYVIDGIVGGDLFMIPPQEIESVKILKDLSETSFYGSEGTNGVILVTTKSGKKDKKLSVDFNSSVSLGKVTGLSGLLTADQMRVQAKTHPTGNFVDGGGSTNWQDEIYRSTVSQSYQLSLGGTLKNTSYRVSFDRIDQPGNVKESDRNITGGSATLSQTALKNKLKIDGLASYYLTNSQFINYSADRGEENVLYQTFIRNPTDPVYNSDGSSYNMTPRVYSYNNPLALINKITNTGKTDQFNAMLNATWDIWKGLGIKINGSYLDNKITSHYYRQTGAYEGSDTYTENGSDHNTRMNLLAGITYKRQFGKNHFLDLFAGYILRSSSTENAMSYLNNHRSWNTTILNSKNKDYAIRATLNYHFQQKYYLNVVLNQEHNQTHVISEYNSANNLGWGQWGFYPGIHVSWEINHEKFMKNIKPISTLILKAGYGISGARPEDHYIDQLNEGYNDRKLNVERTSEFTVSLEAGFIHNRIMASIEYYNRSTENAITKIPLPLPPNPVDFTYTNGMKVSNNGLELKITGKVLDKKRISWNSMLCFSKNNNKIISIDGEYPIKSGLIDYYTVYSPSQYLFTTKSGYSILAYNLPEFVSYRYGEPVYVKKDGTYTTIIDEAKRDITDKVFPAYILSWTNTFTLFKSLDLSLMFRYVGGYQIFNATRMYLSKPSNYLSLNTLQEAGTNADKGILITPFSGMYLENASYLRLENLSVGYTFIPQCKKWKGKLRVYLAVNNVFTITGYSGLDPAFNFNSPGLDYFNTYPSNHVYTLGINLEI